MRSNSVKFAKAMGKRTIEKLMYCARCFIFFFFPEILCKTVFAKNSEMNEDLITRRRVSIRTVDGCIVEVPMSIAR
jgi:hypothetical protein